MNKLCTRIFCALFIIASAPLAAHTREPEEQEPGLLVTSGAIALQQSDFDSGSYRIQQPGYYYLAEDIEFQPIFDDEATRTDKPIQGWFTALSIECDNVIIDLNTKTLECSQDFVNTQTFKVFSMIELANSPFPHFVFAYTGETELKYAHNVIIKNGTLGRSSHHGIHGNNNSNIQMYDMTIKDWEVASIGLNALQSGVIKNCTVSGIEHDVPFTGLFADMNMALIQLQLLKNEGDMGAQGYIDALNVMLTDSTQNGRINPPAPRHDSNTYGIFINRALDVGPLDSHCDEASANCILIENVQICNIHTGIIETVGMTDNDGNILKGEVFGVMRWFDAYPNGTFAPNAFIRAQAYATKQRDADRDPADRHHPAGLDDAILNGDETTFLSLVKPNFNADFAGHTTKGAFGIRIDGGHGVTIKDCEVMAITNTGALPLTLDDIPAGSHYDPSIVSQYMGNDVYGISFAVCRNSSIENCSATECSSTNGYVRGISLRNCSVANTVSNCISTDHYALLDDITSTVHPSSHVFGFYVDNESNNNEFNNCRSDEHSSPRYTYGFYADTTSNNRFISCSATGLVTTSTNNFDSTKTTAGFASTSGVYNIFDDCTVINMNCEGEDTASSASESQAISFAMTSESYTTIRNSEASCNNSGAGQAVGIKLDNSANMVVINNTSNHHHGSSHSVGYGLVDQQVDSGSLILKNKAFGNQTANYLTDVSIPLTTVMFSSPDSEEWHNLAL